MTNVTPEVDGEDEVVATGRLFEIVHRPMRFGQNRRVFEFARRAPGTRLIFVRDRRVLLIREYRAELERIDLRLPGGKVADSLEEYAALRASGSLEEVARSAASREAQEEVGLIPTAIEQVGISKAGATVEWDLYYYVVTAFEPAPHGPSREVGEESIETEWTDFDDVEAAILSGEFGEDRSVPYVLRAMRSSSSR